MFLEIYVSYILPLFLLLDWSDTQYYILLLAISFSRNQLLFLVWDLAKLKIKSSVTQHQSKIAKKCLLYA